MGGGPFAPCIPYPVRGSSSGHLIRSSTYSRCHSTITTGRAQNTSLGLRGGPCPALLSSSRCRRPPSLHIIISAPPSTSSFTLAIAAVAESVNVATLFPPRRRCASRVFSLCPSLALALLVIWLFAAVSAGPEARRAQKLDGSTRGGRSKKFARHCQRTLRPLTLRRRASSS